MAKPVTSTAKTDPHEAATAALIEIVNVSLPFRMNGTAVPTLDVLAKLAAAGSRLLKLDKESSPLVQNSAVLQLMKSHNILAG